MMREGSGGKGLVLSFPLPRALYLTKLSIYSSGSSRDAHWECVRLVCGIAVGCVFCFQDS